MEFSVVPPASSGAASFLHLPIRLTQPHLRGWFAAPSEQRHPAMVPGLFVSMKNKFADILRLDRDTVLRKPMSLLRKNLYVFPVSPLPVLSETSNAARQHLLMAQRHSCEVERESLCFGDDAAPHRRIYPQRMREKPPDKQTAVVSRMHV